MSNWETGGNWVHEIGHRGQEVRRLQEKIGAHVDGKFGKKTEKQLKDYQLQNGLDVDGRSGPATRASMGIDIYSGIDVSHHQGVIDWPAVKASGGVDFCWAKATEGNNYIDPRVQKNVEGCRAVGIPVGVYHFARPDLHDDPHKEVKNFVRNCAVDVGDLRPVMDFERNGEHSPASLHAWVVEFLKETEDALGIRPIIYTGGNMTKYGLAGDTSVLDTYTLWHAAYSRKSRITGIKKDRLGTWKEWTIWQWGDKGSVGGIKSNVDKNWLVGGPLAYDGILIK
jgi:lysozyme